MKACEKLTIFDLMEESTFTFCPPTEMREARTMQRRTEISLDSIFTTFHSIFILNKKNQKSSKFFLNKLVFETLIVDFLDFSLQSSSTIIRFEASSCFYSFFFWFWSLRHNFTLSQSHFFGIRILL